MRDALRFSLIKKLSLIGLAGVLSGCMVVRPYDRDRPRDDTPPYGWYDLWFQDAEVYCEYSVADQISHWTLVANPDTTDGPGEIDDVYASIEGSYLYSYNAVFHLAPVSEGEWRASFDNIGTPENSYHCINSYDFLFTAYDYSGYQVAQWVEW